MPDTISADRSLLERVAAEVASAHESARLLAFSLKYGTDAEALPGLAQDAAAATGRAVDRLGALGIRPDTAPPASASALEDLLALEAARPQAQTLLAALRNLIPLAQEIDRARGRWWPDSPDSQPGTDLAEDLVQLVARIELDLHGPALSVTGGRE